ncbi:MAG: hypothetical protein EXS37_04595 [Opitutus sp.]|nr:hypothetical protein [Opitutus sp.]
MSLGYDYTLNRASCEALNGFSPRARGRLLDFCRSLAERPFTAGDYHETDEQCWRVEVMLVEDRYLVRWHVDHAAKDVRVFEIEAV